LKFARQFAPDLEESIENYEKSKLDLTEIKKEENFLSFLDQKQKDPENYGPKIGEQIAPMKLITSEYTKEQPDLLSEDGDLEELVTPKVLSDQMSSK